jgi:DNA-binding transcriptional LysR family regulator
LERRLGFELFERGHKIVKPTDASRAYVEQARLSLLHGERAFQAARAAKENAEVILNVGKSPYTDPFLTSTLLSIQLPLFPWLRIELTSQYSCDLAHEVLAGGLYLAIPTGPPESPLLTTVKVNEALFYIAMSKRDALAGQPRQGRALSIGLVSLFAREVRMTYQGRRCGQDTSPQAKTDRFRFIWLSLIAEEYVKMTPRQ